MVGSSNGSPALASSQSDGPVDLTIAETSNKVDCMGAGVRPAPSATPRIKLLYGPSLQHLMGLTWAGKSLSCSSMLVQQSMDG